MIAPGIRVRTMIIFWLLMVWWLMVWALYGVRQLYQGAWLAAYGKRQYAVELVTHPPRALIYDRHGLPLAMNDASVAAFITPRAMQDRPAVARFLSQHFPTAYERLAQKERAAFMYVKRGLTPEERAVMREADLADIYFLEEPTRFYPISAVAPIIGVTDRDNQGISGIELLYNAQLAGLPTRQRIERDARSGMFYFSQEMIDAGRLGKPVTLTIDAGIQQIAAREVREACEQWHAVDSTAIVLNPQTGELLAVAQYPLADESGIVTCRPIAHAYEYGSVIKIFLALAAFERELFTPDDIIDCEHKKTTYVNGMKVNTWKAHGKLSFAHVIEQSNNIGTAKIAQKVGTSLYDIYRRIGFGTRTGIDFPGEQSGFVNPPDLWSKASLNSLSFGYEIRTTLLQLACAFGAIACDGKRVAPHFIKDAPQPPEGDYVCTVHTARQLQELLRLTVAEGTAYRAQIDGYTIMGKTGSALLLVDGHYDPGHSLYTFVGIVRCGDYCRVIAVAVRDVTQRAIFASTVAAPLFQKIAQQVLIHDRIIQNKAAT